MIVYSQRQDMENPVAECLQCWGPQTLLKLQLHLRFIFLFLQNFLPAQNAKDLVEHLTSSNNSYTIQNEAQSNLSWAPDLLSFKLALQFISESQEG